MPLQNRRELTAKAKLEALKYFSIGYELCCANGGWLFEDDEDMQIVIRILAKRLKAPKNKYRELRPSSPRPAEGGQNCDTPTPITLPSSSTTPFETLLNSNAQQESDNSNHHEVQVSNWTEHLETPVSQLNVNSIQEMIAIDQYHNRANCLGQYQQEDANIFTLSTNQALFHRTPYNLPQNENYRWSESQQFSNSNNSNNTASSYQMSGQNSIRYNTDIINNSMNGTPQYQPASGSYFQQY